MAARQRGRGDMAVLPYWKGMKTVPGWRPSANALRVDPHVLIPIPLSGSG